jgi:branched-chain amino acid transport system ATP-binding protein
MSHALELVQVGAAYGDIEVLHGLDIAIPEGKVTVILGANGAGKSTLLRAICGQVPAVKGSIRLYGEELVGKAAYRIAGAGIAHCPEGRHIFGPMSVDENIRLGAYTRKDRAGIEEDVEKMYAMFPRLRERRAQVAGTMSGGEQQMLAIARALMLRPRVLLLDEPSMGLAPNLVNDVFATIEQLRASGLTIVLVEQFARRALTIADFGFVLSRGGIVLSGTAADLAQDVGLVSSYLS